MQQKLLQILQKCKNMKELKQAHLHIFIHGLQGDRFLLPKLIQLSSTFHSLDYAIQIFQNEQFPNVVVYNTIIKCFSERSHNKDAFLAFNRMNKSNITPNTFTFTFLLKSCQMDEALEEGAEIHTHIVKSGFELNVFVQNTLLDFYSKCSLDLDCCSRVFDEMLERDVVSWNSMISAYMSHGEMASAIQLFESMPERNIISWNSVITGLVKAGDMVLARSIFERMPTRDPFSWNTMISGYIRCGDVITARSIFDMMRGKDVVSWTAMISGYTKVGDLDSATVLFEQMPVKNVVSWNAMITGYVQNRQFDQALLMFHQMLMNGMVRPDEATVTGVLSACAHLGALDHGNWIHSYIKKNKFHITVALGNALLDMYAKCGDVQNAKGVFNGLRERCIITWTAMVSGLAINGYCREALVLFDKMCSERIEPDDVIFITVLSACTHGGLVEEGLMVFDRMVRGYGIKPRIEHYGCMVDLLSRAGKLEEAIGFIERMPMEPNAVLWVTLLGSCKIYGNGQLAEFVTRRILDLEPSNPGYRVLISNLNASIGRWEDVSNIRAGMKEEGIEKVPGCSSIQVGSGVHEFLVKDTRHGQRREIYDTLYGLTEQLREVGYVPFRSHKVKLNQGQLDEVIFLPRR
ncbi:pentatricopeptide repeat-containing protein At3g29230-like [Tasmannia lanceolata]|uniref:pentatricopeptide repeat-containing protein At3g29230-like n=1 Tax=Tasmannia lanceolata TaxID=3420 RepID=UPI004062C00A